MAISHEAPSFAVTYQDDLAVHGRMPEDASLLWHDIPNMYVWGDQEKYRLRTATHPLGRVAVIGACFADQESLDAALVRALEGRQPEALTHLPGAYVTILHEQDKLTVMRDVAGAFPVYFSGDQDAPMISSDPTIAAGEAGLVPNIAQTAANLTLLVPNEGAIGGNVSCFEGVNKLMGAQAIVVDEEGHSVYTYEPLRADETLTRESAASRLREALRVAVRARLESGVPVSANLSGGVDSSSIVALVLESMEQSRRLPVFFMDNPGHESDDKKLFSSYVAQDGRLEPNLFDMNSLPHINLGQFETPVALSTVANPAREAFLAKYYEAVHAAGVGRLHFTGNGGDEVVGMGPYYLPDLLRKGKVGRFLKEGSEWARIYNTSPYRMWRAMGRLALSGPRGTLEAAANRVAKYDHKKTGDPVDALAFWRPDETALGWLTPEARQQLSEYLMERSKASEMANERGMGEFIAKERIRAAANDQGLESYNVPAGISLQSPFLDHNVVRAAMAAEATIKGSPYEFKLLLRDALKGVVPEDILNRPSKGVYGSASRDRHFEALRTLVPLLDDSILERLGVIDSGPIRKELARLEMVSPSAMWALTQILVTERWLRSLDLPDEMLDSRRDQASARQATIGDRRAASANLTAHFSVPDYIHFVSSTDGSLIAYNQKTDLYHPLTVTQSNALRVLSYSGSIQQAIDQLGALYQNVPEEKLINDVCSIVSKFQDLGIVTPGIAAEPRILPTQTAPRFVSEEFHTAREEGVKRVTRRNKALAAVALMGTELVNRITPKRRSSILKGLQRWTTEPASQEVATEALLAVQSSKYIGRIACLQASYAAAIALALQGKKVDWHIGVSFSPLDIHAWIEAEGKPVRTSKDGRVMGSYQSFFS